MQKNERAPAAALAAVLLGLGLSTFGAGRVAGAPGLDTRFAASAHRAPTQSGDGAELAARVKALSARAGGRVGVAIIHVETGRAVSVGGETPLPLYSVFKLPLAVAVLMDVEEGRLRLEQRVRVTPADVAPGSRVNTDLWREPVERTVAVLLDLSLVRSDNTSSDKLLQLVGGPERVTERMRALGLQRIDVRAPVRGVAGQGVSSNTGTADDVARLLVLIQKGQALGRQQRALLVAYMGRAVTGMKRLRGDLPAGTPVADKTGTGPDGAATNDVGIITLPGGKGHLAVAVLISGSELNTEAQEKLIAEIARAAYDAHA